MRLPAALVAAGRCGSSLMQRRAIFDVLGKIAAPGPLVHRERKIVPYSAEQVFDVVADVDNYHKFLPWCQSSKCTRGASDRERVGELVIGFREFNERYVSHISLDRPHRIRVAAQRGLLFKHQVTTWEFKQLTGATDRSHGSTRVSFEIDFEFESLLYRQAAELFLSEVAKRMVDAFNSRCATLYGLRPSPGRRS